MSPVKVMHIEDEPDIRDVVRISLGLDPDMTVRSFASAQEGLTALRDWSPDLVLLDVMMPGIDGPTTLAMLRADPAAADIPVVFMTAKVQTRELDYFRSLGAADVLAKPFDPGTLAAKLRAILRPKPPGLEILEREFLLRAAKDADDLADCAASLSTGRDRQGQLGRARRIAHGLAGAGGIFGFRRISADAAALDDLIASAATSEEICRAIEELRSTIAASAATRGAAAIAGRPDPRSERTPATPA